MELYIRNSQNLLSVVLCDPVEEGNSIAFPYTIMNASRHGSVIIAISAMDFDAFSRGEMITAGISSYLREEAGEAITWARGIAFE